VVVSRIFRDVSRHRVNTGIAFNHQQSALRRHSRFLGRRHQQDWCRRIIIEGRWSSSAQCTCCCIATTAAALELVVSRGVVVLPLPLALVGLVVASMVPAAAASSLPLPIAASSRAAPLAAVGAAARVPLLPPSAVGASVIIMSLSSFVVLVTELRAAPFASHIGVLPSGCCRCIAGRALHSPE
jgi:hypothetical protein